MVYKTLSEIKIFSQRRKARKEKKDRNARWPCIPEYRVSLCPGSSAVSSPLRDIRVLISDKVYKINLVAELKYYVEKIILQ